MHEKIIIGEGKHIRLIVEGTWEYVERINVSGIVVILAVNDDNKIIFIEQHRPPVDGSVIELPAGLVGDIPGQEDEKLIDAAKRELYEETGYEAKEMTLITEGPPSAGISREIISFFQARGLNKTGDGGGDETEEIKVHEIPLNEADSWLQEKIKAGFHVDPKVFAGLYFALKS